MLQPRQIQAKQCGHWMESLILDEIVDGQDKRVPREIIPNLCNDCREARRTDPATQARVAAYLESGAMQTVLGQIKDARVGQITDQLVHGS